MTPCARGCCWSPFGCARSRDCDCHWGDWLLSRPANNGAVTNYRDPTSAQAIRNIERDRRKRSGPR